MDGWVILQRLSVLKRISFSNGSHLQASSPLYYFTLCVTFLNVFSAERLGTKKNLQSEDDVEWRAHKRGLPVSVRKDFINTEESSADV